MMRYKKMVFAGLILSLTGTALFAGPATVAGKTVFKAAVEAGAKKSGKALTPALRTAAEESLKKAAVRYGDDAVLAVQKGGLEVLEQGARHGDDFWHLCAKSTPDAARALAIHADEFMPIVKRVGPEFLELEGKTQGLGKRVIATFGDRSVKSFSNIPASDIPRILGYAERAESPAVAKGLLEGYEKTGGRILDHLNWKHIMATGLSASAVLTAYKLSGGVENGLKIIAEKHPETFRDAISTLTRPVRYFLYGLGVLLLYPVFVLSRRLAKWIRANPEKKDQKEEKNPEM